MSKTIYAKTKSSTQIKIFRGDDIEDLEKKMNDYFFVLDNMREFRDPVTHEWFKWTLSDIRMTESQQITDRFNKPSSYATFTAMVIIQANYDIAKTQEILEVLAKKVAQNDEV